MGKHSAPQCATKGCFQTALPNEKLCARCVKKTDKLIEDLRKPENDKS